MYDTRKATDRLLEMVEEGLLDKDTVIPACVKYMSEDDVAGMMDANEWSERFDPEEELEEEEAEDNGCTCEDECTCTLADLPTYEETIAATLKGTV